MKTIKVEGKADIVTIDLISWIETHFEVSKWLGVILNQKELNSDGEINIKQAMNDGCSCSTAQNILNCIAETTHLVLSRP